MTFVRFVSCLILFSQLQSDHHRYLTLSLRRLLIIHLHCIDYHRERHPIDDEFDANFTIAVFYFRQTRLNLQRLFKGASCPHPRTHH